MGFYSGIEIPAELHKSRELCKAIHHMYNLQNIVGKRDFTVSQSFYQIKNAFAELIWVYFDVF